MFLYTNYCVGVTHVCKISLKIVQPCSCSLLVLIKVGARRCSALRGEAHVRPSVLERCRELLLHGRPQAIHADRLAASSFLILGNGVESRLHSLSRSCLQIEHNGSNLVDCSSSLRVSGLTSNRLLSKVKLVPVEGDESVDLTHGNCAALVTERETTQSGTGVHLFDRDGAGG